MKDKLTPLEKALVHAATCHQPPLVVKGYLDPEHPTKGGPAALPNGNPDGYKLTGEPTEGEKLAGIVEDLKRACDRLMDALAAFGRVV